MTEKNTPTTRLTRDGAGGVTARAALGGSSAVAQVKAKRPGNSGEIDGYARAGALHALAGQLADAGNLKDARAAADQGLRLLGDTYFEPPTRDDTRLKLRNAEDLLDRGEEETGTRAMLRVLESRLDQFRRTHAAEMETPDSGQT